MPITYISETSILPIPENVKRIVFTLIGGGGGGEHIGRLDESSSPGFNGGDTTFLGLTAGGGQGGGFGEKYGGGNGGVASTGNFDFTAGALESPESTMTLSNGTRGGLNAKGESGATTVADRFFGDGGNGTGKQVTYNFSVNHIFRNSPPWAIGQVENSPDISVSINNPSTQGAPCGVRSWSRHYGINFNYTFDDTSYSVTITSQASRTAAGGNFSGYGQIGSKTASGCGVWWCKYKLDGSGTVNSFIRSFSLRITGNRSALLGRGGGGGAEISGILDRADLVERGLLDLNTSLYIGEAGRENGGPIAPFANDGAIGKGRVYIEFETRTYINIKNNETNTIIQGQSATLEWEVSGDADWALVEPGISPQTNNFSNFVSEVTVTPTSTTTYFVRADGVIGGFSESEVTLTVLQPPTVIVVGPESIDYGNDIELSYEATNVATSLTLRPVFYFLDGSTLEGSEYNVALETGEEVDNNTIYQLTPWGDTGPVKIEFNLDAVGYSYDVNGITNYLTQSGQTEVDVDIDIRPDTIAIPETNDAIKSQQPVISPEKESTITLLITDIDIPVTIKADSPVQVEINDDGIYRDVERIE
ncbi:hypothetical protein S250808_028 [Synechococcus phage S-CAM3]|uniref:Virion structural protein n=1 Tax=Synechococcus phage S-CAM3 TaxID=1883366 RepID=A0A1D8KIQ8_9CAUD|nr:hypothetical protein S250808_028 [Synechococcus phage S-CAM3]